MVLMVNGMASDGPAPYTDVVLLMTQVENWLCSVVDIMEHFFSASNRNQSVYITQ